MNTSNLTLFQREECPFSHLVRKKLTQLGLPAMLIPVEEKGIDRKELIELSGQRAVPVLVDGEEVIVDSAVIIEYLDTKYGTGENQPLASSDYGIRALVTGDFETVKSKTLEAFKAEGFGMLTEIDIQATLKKKINVDIEKNSILGMCNPNMAHEAMQAEADLGLLLPCNVVIRQAEAGKFWVSAINPVKLFTVVGRNDMVSMAMQVKQLMGKAIESLDNQEETVAVAS